MVKSHWRPNFWSAIPVTHQENPSFLRVAQRKLKGLGNWGGRWWPTTLFVRAEATPPQQKVKRTFFKKDVCSFSFYSSFWECTRQGFGKGAARRGPTHLGLLVHVPGEGNGIVGDLLDVPDGVEALLVISCNRQREKDLSRAAVRWGSTRLQALRLGSKHTRMGPSL